MYEDTAGLTVGDPVLRKRQPLSLELGPGIMGTIFDGIQRPLEDIFRRDQNVYIPRGADIPSLDPSKKWQYTPVSGLREGMAVSGGDIFGTVYENELISSHKIMIPPNIYGKVKKVYGSAADKKDSYTVEDTVLEVENETTKQVHKLKLSHFWPVRRPRPVVAKLPGNTVSACLSDCLPVSLYLSIYAPAGLSGISIVHVS